MIEWWVVVTGATWILGVSTLLAAFSYHDWVAGETARQRRDGFAERSWRLFCALGMLLLCSGWGLSLAARWWERTLWFALAASFAWRLLALTVTGWGSPPPIDKASRRV